MKTFLTSLLFIISFLLLETAVLSNVFFFPVVPDLLLIFVIYLSVHKGSLTGETAGFASGFLLDLLSSAPLGLNALLRTLIGFFAGFFYLSLNTSGFFIPFFLGAVATLIKALLLGILSFFFPNSVFAYPLFSSKLWIETLLNGLLTPVLFLVFSKFTSIAEDSSEQT